MGFLNDIMAMDAAAVVSAELMPGAESVTYIKRDGGGSRVIAANVFREKVEPIAGVSQASVMKVSIHVQNSATLGISAAELDNGDSIQLDMQLDGRLVKKSINTATLRTDVAMIRMELI